MAELRLAGPEFSKNLSHRPSLYSTLEELVQLNGTCRQGNDGRAIDQSVGSRLEVHRDHRFGQFLQFQDLGLYMRAVVRALSEKVSCFFPYSSQELHTHLADTLDLAELPDSGVGEGFDRMVAFVIELRRVKRGYERKLESDEQFGDEQFGDEQSGDEQSGDEQFADSSKTASVPFQYQQQQFRAPREPPSSYTTLDTPGPPGPLA